MWESVRTLKDRHSKLSVPQRRCPKHLLSGLLRCGRCSGPYIEVDKDRFGCSTNKESQTCNNGRRANAVQLEEVILGGLRNQLLAPDAVAQFIKTYRGLWLQKMKRLQENGRANAKRQRDIKSKIDRIVRAITDRMASKALHANLIDLEKQQEELERAASLLVDPTKIELHPNLAETYRNQVANLVASLNAPDHR